MPLRRVVSALVALAAAAGLAAPAEARREWPGGASYSVPTRILDAALECSRNLAAGAGEPVLLVHGTGVNREMHFKWNYWSALRHDGFALCWVELPKAALGDMQIAAEYVARAIDVMHEHSGRRVDVVGHSQGAVLPRWAIKFFPSGRFVDDYVGLAGPNHGTVVADVLAAAGETGEAVWQMRFNSRFMPALNRGDETPGPISYTSIYSQFDEQVQPWTTAAIAGAENVLVQDVCPGRVVTHWSMLLDNVTYELVVDALTHPGAADPARLAHTICLTLWMPGAEPALPSAIAMWDPSVITPREPPLRPYARR